jgi:hypothetical protein
MSGPRIPRLPEQPARGTCRLVGGTGLTAAAPAEPIASPDKNPWLDTDTASPEAAAWPPLPIEGYEAYIEGFSHGMWHGVATGLIVGVSVVVIALQAGLQVGP